MQCSPTTDIHPFPYTTLFRSGGTAASDDQGRAPDGPRGGRAGRVIPRRRAPGAAGAGEPAGERSQVHAVGRDRKSTRLNSSHGYISYAVFCLKKKNKDALIVP